MSAACACGAVKRRAASSATRVAAPDPAALTADAGQTRGAQRAVPRVDPDPAVSALDYPEAVLALTL